MSASIVLPLAVVVIAGAAVATQPAFNGQLAALLGSPLRAALVNFLAGSAVMLVTAVVFTARGGVPSAATLSQVPAHLWIVGGALGSLFVSTAAWAAPKIGAGPFFATLIAAQLIAAIVLDHFGLIGLQQKSISLMRVAGALMLMAGAALVVRG